jgi:hypothetical protein
MGEGRRVSSGHHASLHHPALGVRSRLHISGRGDIAVMPEDVGENRL